MNNNINNITNTIYQQGQYYHPSYKRFGKVMSISCIRCQKQNLISSIGWKKYDLCLHCVVDLDLNYESKIRKPNFQPNTIPVTYYDRDMFSDKFYNRNETYNGIPNMFNSNINDMTAKLNESYIDPPEIDYGMYPDEVRPKRSQRFK